MTPVIMTNKINFLIWMTFLLSVSCVMSEKTQSQSYSVNMTELCGDDRGQYVVLNTHTVLNVQSPNFTTGHYPNNVNCSLVLSTEGRPVVIKITFSSFDLELSRLCQSDFLCLLGVNFCGDWLTNRILEYIVPENQTFTIVFTSDPEISAHGFKAALETRDAMNQTVSYPYAGVGSSPSQQFYTTKTYGRKYAESYRDKCAH